MLQRETCIKKLISQISEVTGIGFFARNPDSAPEISDFPAVLLFELPDDVESVTKRGGYPAYKRKIRVAIEIYISGSTENAATTELSSFVEEVKKKIYEGGATLNLPSVFIYEVEAGRVIRPAIGGNAAGISLLFDIGYIENVADLF